MTKTYLMLLNKTQLLSLKEKRQLLINLFKQNGEGIGRGVLDRRVTRIEEHRAVYDVVNESMCWDSTPQGHRYWEEITTRVSRRVIMTEDAENL